MRDRLLAGAVVVPFVLGFGFGAGPPDGGGEPVFRFQDPEIVESSGLVVQDGLVFTTNDSGDSGRVFAVDPATGRTVGVTRWEDDPTDVEALAPAGDGAVWVGDIGDNTESRDTVQVARVLVGRGERTVDVDRFDLVYPDGPKNAESLLSDPASGRLYVATKSVFGGQLFRAPARLRAGRPNLLSAVGDVLPIATDGAFLPDGEHLVLRDYSQAVVYTFPGLERVAAIRLPAQEQGEGISVAADGTLLVSTEGQYSEVLRVRLPEDVAALSSPSASPSASGSASGSAGAGSSDEGTYSRQGREQPGEEQTDRPVWPWFLTGWVVVVGFFVLLRALRPR